MHFSSRLGICILVNNSKSKGREERERNSGRGRGREFRMSRKILSKLVTSTWKAKYKKKCYKK